MMHFLRSWEGFMLLIFLGFLFGTFIGMVAALLNNVHKYIEDEDAFDDIDMEDGDGTKHK